MSTVDKSFEELRNVLHRAKLDLDAIGRSVEEEFTKQMDSGLSFYKLVQKVSQMEYTITTLEREFYDIQTIKTELSTTSELLIQNWNLLEEIRSSSGLSKTGSETVEPLEQALVQMKTGYITNPHT